LSVTQSSPNTDEDREKLQRVKLLFATAFGVCGAALTCLGLLGFLVFPHQKGRIAPAIAILVVGAGLVALGRWIDPSRPWWTVGKALRPSLRLMGLGRGRSRSMLWTGCLVAVVSAVLVHWVNKGIVAVLPHHPSTASETALGAERATWFHSGPVALRPLWIVLMAACEEIVFRSPVVAAAVVAHHRQQRGHNSWPMLVVGAIIWIGLSIIAFGLFHSQFGIANVVTAAVSGAVFGALAWWTRTLWPALTCHSVFNMIAVWPL
jgi:membrane protease YdiL (CAAX protease family)